MPTGDDRSLGVAKNYSVTIKETFPNHNQKYNVSLNQWHELNTKIIDYFIVDNEEEPWYYSRPSGDYFKTVWLSIFKLNDSIYFIFGDFWGLDSKYWGCIGINLWHHFETTLN